MSSAGTGWDAYLARFHAEHPGITETILGRARAGDRTPYGWLLDGVDPTAHIVDLGCGSGPARPEAATRWVGLDRSTGELRAARAAGRRSLVRGDARHLPLADDLADVVTSSLSLMLVRPLVPALEEIGRVLRPGGELRLLLPSRRPLTWEDRYRYLRLFLAQRSTTRFPRSSLRDDPAAVLATAGLTVESDERERFTLALEDDGDAGDLVASWYLPGVASERRAAAARRARSMVPTSIGIPLRRVVARRGEAGQATSSERSSGT